MMSFVNEHVKYQPQFNSVLDEVDSLKVRVEELEQENRHLHNTLNALDERINILINDKR